MSEAIHKLAKLTKDQYDDITTPSMNTLYFTIDTGELYLGTVKIGAGFKWTDENEPRPDVGVKGYFYIERSTLDMYIWNELLYRWVYFGNAGNNSISIDQFNEFKKEVTDSLNKMQKEIDDITKNHNYTESRISFKTDAFTKIVDTDYWCVALDKTADQAKMLVKNVYTHLDGADSYQAVYPDITETSKKVVLQFTVPADGFCILN